MVSKERLHFMFAQLVLVYNLTQVWLLLPISKVKQLVYWLHVVNDVLQSVQPIHIRQPEMGKSTFLGMRPLTVLEFRKCHPLHETLAFLIYAIQKHVVGPKSSGIPLNQLPTDSLSHHCIQLTMVV
jgi:hypothetical protein